MTRDEVIELLRQRCAEAGTQKAWARANGLSAVYVGDTIRGKKEPAGKLLAALGLERVVSYRNRKDNGANR